MKTCSQCQAIAIYKVVVNPVRFPKTTNLCDDCMAKYVANALTDNKTQTVGISRITRS
jgi:hypothetical protein